MWWQLIGSLEVGWGLRIPQLRQVLSSLWASIFPHLSGGAPYPCSPDLGFVGTLDEAARRDEYTTLGTCGPYPTAESPGFLECGYFVGDKSLTPQIRVWILLSFELEAVTLGHYPAEMKTKDTRVWMITPPIGYRCWEGARKTLRSQYAPVRERLDKLW